MAGLLWAHRNHGTELRNYNCALFSALYLKGVAECWFPTSSDLIIKWPYTDLKTAFKERFASGPHDRIFLQQLSAPKQRSKKALGDYVVSMLNQLKLCKLWKLVQTSYIKRIKLFWFLPYNK